MAFRWPTLEKHELDVLYSSGADSSWDDQPGNRHDWRIAKTWISEGYGRGATVLDLGCFDGRFLETLDSGCRRLGVEIHPAARRRAEDRGIGLVGSDLASITLHPASVDCITAFDVIEHVHSPAQLLARCGGLVRKGGSIIVATGNVDARTFRLLGSRYWYCSIAEHVSFISPAWCEHFAKLFDLTIEKQVVFSHGRHDLFHFAPQLIKNMLYKVAPGLFSALRRRGLGGIDVSDHAEVAEAPPTWIGAMDHFITCFRKT